MKFISVLFYWILSTLILIVIGCTSEVPIVSPLGEMTYPEDNPQSTDKIDLGKKLFFDTRLSADGTVSCATCHIPEYAFTDRKQFSDGVSGHHSLRNAPSLLNSGYLKTLMFDAEITSLEMQVIVPIQDTNEMGMAMSDLIRRLKSIPLYQKSAQAIFHRDFDPFVLTRSLAAYQRSLISDNSRFDRAERGEIDRSAEEERGWKLFSEELYCTKCHPSPHFTTFIAENNGLYLDYSKDEGRFRIDFDSSEIGFFKIPSLRNIELTHPYMHDGSLKTLNDVIDHYGNGGMNHRSQSSYIQPFTLSVQERSDLNSFLKSLTDTSYLKMTKN